MQNNLFLLSRRSLIQTFIYLGVFQTNCEPEGSEDSRRISQKIISAYGVTGLFEMNERIDLMGSAA